MIYSAYQDWLNAQNDPSYDPATMRVVMSPDAIDHLPVRYVTRAELVDAMSRLRYNPSVFYQDDVDLYPNERGHDHRARYVLVNPTR